MSCSNCDCKYCEQDRDDEIDPDEGIDDPSLRALRALWRSCDPTDQAEVMIYIKEREKFIEMDYLENYWMNY